MIRNKISRVTIVFIFILNITLLNAATKTWIGTTSSWKTASNWSGGIPGPSDIAVFNGTGVGNCSIDTATVSVASFQMNAGYTGTITQSATNTSLTIGSSNATFTAGTFVGNAVSGTGIIINGTFTLSGTNFTSTSGTLTFNNTVTNTSGTFTHNSGTVTFNSSSAQTMPLWNFYNLTSSNTGARTLASGTINVFNTFTPFTNAYTTAGNTVNYNGTGGQTIAAFNYYNLSSSSTGTRTLAPSGTIGIANTFTKGPNSYPTITGSTIDYNGTTTAQTVTAFNYNNLTLSGVHNGNIVLASSGTIGIAGAFVNTASFSSGSFVNATSTISYNGIGAQTVITFDYYHLTITGAHTTNNISLASSGIIKVAGTFANTATFTTGGIVNTSSTIEYNGAGAQTIGAFNYNNLTISSSHAGSITLANTGIIGIAGAFSNTATFSSGAYINTSSTINYNGTGAQTIIAFDYYNLIISGARGANNVTLASSGTIKIAKIFNNFAIFTSGSFVNTTSTIELNGSLIQVIPPFPYNNIISSSTGPRSLASTGIIKISDTFTKGSNTYNSISLTGEGYAPQYSGTSSSLLGAAAVSTTTAFMCGVGGMILKTTDGGATWVSQTSNTLNDLYGISFINADTGIASGNTGTIVRTTNGGTTWSAVTSGTAQSFRSATFINSTIGFVTGGGGVILKTADAGATWSAITSGTSQGMYAVSFTTSTTGYASGGAGTILKTTNTGSTWSALTTGTTELLGAIQFVNTSVGIAAGANGKIIRTADGGTTWTNISSGTSDNFSTLAFIDANKGYIAGGNVANNTGTLMQTTDGGLTWTMINPGTTRLYGIDVMDATTAYITGLDGNILKYTCCVDGGTVEFNGGSSQTIPALNYHNLISSSSGARVLTSSGTIGISGKFIKGSNTFTNTGSTIDYNGMLAQTIKSFNYNNLTISGNKTSYNDTLGNGDTISISGTFSNTTTYTTGSFIKTGNTFNYNGNNTQTVVAFNYNNLIISGTHTGNNVTLINGGTIGISGTLSNTGSFSGGSIITTGNTIDFNGAVQNIPLFIFNNLTLSGSGDKTATGDLTINGILNINSGRILNMSTNSLLGTITSTIGAGTLRTQKTGATPIPVGKTWLPTVEYNSSSAQTIVYGSYKDLNASGGSRTISATDTVHISGTFTPGSGYTVTGSTVDFNGSVQTVPVVTYNNFKVNGTGNKTVSGTLTINGGLTISSGSVLDLATNPLTGSLGSINGTGTLKTQNTGLTPIPTGKTWTFDVEYNGGSQSVINGTYSNLIINGSGNKSATGNLNINGVLTINSGRSLDMGTNLITGSITSTSGTGIIKTQNTSSTPIPVNKTWSCAVQYNSVSSQTIVNGNYTDLDGTGGNRVLSSTGTIGVASVFTVGVGTYTNAGSKIDFNGSASQTIPVFNYNNLTLSGIRTSNNVTFSSGTITVNGNMTVNTTFTSGSFVTTGNTILFNSNANQYINGSTTAYFNKLSVNKASGKVLLSQPSIVSQQLILSKGVLSTSSTNYLQINNGADTVAGASDSSYVCGPVKKIGNQVFIFPLGDTLLSAGAFHPLSITAPSSATDAYTAQYHALNQTYGTGMQTDSIESISDCEYWTLTRNAGTSVVVPSVSWNINSCNVNNYENLRTAYWDATSSQWKSLGFGGVSVNNDQGTLLSGIGKDISILPIIIVHPIGAGNNIYAVLKRELDAGYFIVKNGALKFKFDEEYNDLDNKLTFRIISNFNTEVVNSSTVPSSLKPSSDYGERFYSLNVLQCALGNLGNGYFILEVKNEKNEKWFLRFKHVKTINTICNAL